MLDDYLKKNLAVKDLPCSAICYSHELQRTNNAALLFEICSISI